MAKYKEPTAAERAVFDAAERELMDALIAQVDAWTVKHGENFP
jgi:hypothetical protein